MNILHFTSILPSPLQYKIPANDILLRLATEYEKKYPDDKHFFILILPYTNRILAVIKTKWKEYYQLIRAAKYEIEGRKIHVIGVPAFKNDLKIRHLLAKLGFFINKKRLRQIIKDIKPDLVHAHNFMNNMELAEVVKKNLRMEYVLSARNVNDYSLNRIKNGKVNPRSILAVNHITKVQCSSFLNREVHMIPHPVDDEFYNDLHELKAADKVISIVSVCKIIPLKNLDKVIEALRSLTVDFSYTIIGDGPEKSKMIELVIENHLNEKVTFIGKLAHEKIKQVLKEYDLFVMPSKPETLGRVYFEAMASGLPVLAAKNTGVDGIVSHGIQGFLVNPTKSDEIANSIHAYSNMDSDSQLQMKENAIALARKFTWDVTLEKYYKLYHG